MSPLGWSLGSPPISRERGPSYPRGVRWSRLLTATFLLFTACADDAGDRSDLSKSRQAATGAPATKAAPTLPAPLVSLLLSEPAGRSTEWVEQRAGDTTLAHVARLEHRPAGEVHGVLLPTKHAVVAVADMEGSGDGTFGAWAMLLTPGTPVQKLADRCVHASRPLLLADGGVLLERGKPGPAPDAAAAQAGALRADSLELARLDPATAELTALHSFTGYALHLAGTLESEAFVYRVSHQHADLIALDTSTGSVRELADQIPPFARDFSVDPAQHALFYTNHDGTSWTVDRVDLVTGARTLVTRVGGMWATPHALPGGELLVNDGRGGTLLGGGPLDRPLGAGFDVVEAVSTDGHHAGLSHRRPGTLPEPYLVELQTGAVTALAVPRSARARVIGVQP